MVASRAAPFVAVLRTPALRRVEGGFLLSTIAEWAAWLAIVVVAYDRGGAVEAGIVGFALGAPTVLLVPFASLVGDRWTRSRALLACYVLQALGLVAAAGFLAAGATIAGYLLGVAVMTVIGLVRPLLSSLLPEVSASPDELTAANVASGIVEGAGALAGPLLAGVLLGAAGAPGALATCAVLVGVAAVALRPIASRASSAGSAATGGDGVLEVAGAPGTLLHELGAGVSAILADRRLVVVLAVLAAAVGLLGAVSVFIVVIALDTLRLDEDAVGYLTAMGGLGALVGSTVSVALIGRERLGVPLLASVALFGSTVLLLAIAQEPLGVAIALVGTGLGWSFAYVAATTLIQRLAGDDVLTRVFGVSEAVQTAAETLGILAVPFLVAALGPRDAIVVAGFTLIVVALIAAPILLAGERVDPAFLRALQLLRAVPMFGPLSGPVIERLAAGAVRLTPAPGDVIVAEGAIGDRFYVVASGAADVTVAGRPARSLRAGDVFGEIALLQDVPRTATVRASGPMELLAVDRAPFLEALTGQPRSRRLAADVAAQRLAADHDGIPSP